MDSLIYLVRTAIERANIDNKSVENAVCVLRNLSYRAQEVEDPNYDKRQLPAGESRAAAVPTKAEQMIDPNKRIFFFCRFFSLFSFLFQTSSKIVNLSKSLATGIKKWSRKALLGTQRCIPMLGRTRATVFN